MSKCSLAALVAATLALAAFAPTAAAGDLSIAIGGPHFGVTYTKVHGHHHGHAYVAPRRAPRVCAPRVVVRRPYAPRYVAPPCPPRVVTRVVRVPPVQHVHHAKVYGKTTHKTKHRVVIGKKKTKVFAKSEAVYHH